MTEKCRDRVTNVRRVIQKNKKVEDDHINHASLGNGFGKLEKKLSPNVVKVQSSLKQEILELEKRLQSQFNVHKELEKALGYRKTSQEDNIFTPKSATELIKEIAVLELEISNLEQYLLSLYRKAFDKQASIYVSPSSKQQSSISQKSTLRSQCVGFSKKYQPPKHEKRGIEYRCFSFDKRFKDPLTENDIDSRVLRCQSLLNQRSTLSNRNYPPEESIKEYIKKNRSSIGIRISDRIPRMTSNKLSEEMIKYASTMNCKLADSRCLSSTSELWSLKLQGKLCF